MRERRKIMSEVKIQTWFNDEEIQQQVFWPGRREDTARQIIRLQEQGVREALIKLGWTPPADGSLSLHDALVRQTENMAFVLNHMSMPDHWYERFTRELAEDREALPEPPNKS